MSRSVLQDKFFQVLISGDRNAAREIVNQCIDGEVPADQILEKLFWPTLQTVQKMYREDQISVSAHNYASRILRMLTDQMQLRLEMAEANGRRVLLVCGPDEPNELAAQIACDMLEAQGYEVYFAGAGLVNDELVTQLGEVEPDALVVFSSVPSDLPYVRQLIDHLHDIGQCPQLQVVVGGGVFNRAEGLAEEIGADLWASTPMELVQTMIAQPDRRMDVDQRTVGRRRRSAKAA